MQTMEILRNIVIWAPGAIFAITLHEWAHGYAAYRFGDPTAKMMGRLTLNPLPHIDWIWTILVPVVMLVTVGFVFGGAKPVPINPRFFRGPFRQALFWVSAAGPLMNFLMAALCAVAIRLVLLMPSWFAEPLFEMLQAAILVNVVLGVFNLLPIPPLDGGRVAVAILPSPWDRQWSGLERFGLPLVVVLAFTGMLSALLGPIMGLFIGLYGQLAGFAV